MLSLVIYEDLFSPVMTGEMSVLDAVDMLHNLPIQGFETLEIELGKPTTAQTITKKFRVYKIDNVSVRNETKALMTYTLRFCSEEKILSAYTRVQKSYKGKTITDMIRDITDQKLKMEKVNLDQTTGIHHYIIPGYHPLDAIQWLAARSEPMCVFYENAKGFHFRKYDDLRKAEPVAEYKIGLANLSDKPIAEAPEKLNQLYQVIRHEFMDGTDILKSISNGMYASKLITIDPITFEAKEIKLDIRNQFGKTSHLDNNPMVSGFKDRLSKVINEQYGAVTRVMVTNKSQPNNNRVEDWMLQRKMEDSNLGHFKVNLLVPGNPDIMVGDNVTFQLPRTDDTMEANKYHSGKYLVTAIKHMVTPIAYEMQMEITRDASSEVYQ